MPLFKGFRFSFNLTSKNEKQLDLYENVSPVSVTGAYKPTGEQYYGSGSFGEPLKKITPSMVKLPPPFQPDPTDPDVKNTSKSTGNLTNIETSNLPPKLRKSTPEISTKPQGGTSPNRPASTDLRSSNKTDTKNNKKEQQKLEKKRLAEQKKQEKLEAQQKSKEEKLRKEREKSALKENAKQEKIRIKNEKAKKVPVKTRTNPLAQGPNAPLPYTTNTLESSISKASGPPPYDERKNLEAKNPVSGNTEVVINEKDNTGNTSFGAPIETGNTWDMIAQHRMQVARAPVGSSANKTVIRLQEDEEPSAVAARKSLYV